jgi:hypothetical protein
VKQAGQQALSGRHAEKRARRLIEEMRGTRPDLAKALESDLSLRQKKIMSVADFDGAIDKVMEAFRSP